MPKIDVDSVGNVVHISNNNSNKVSVLKAIPLKTESGINLDDKKNKPAKSAKNQNIKELKNDDGNELDNDLLNIDKFLEEQELKDAKKEAADIKTNSKPSEKENEAANTQKVAKLKNDVNESVKDSNITSSLDEKHEKEAEVADIEKKPQSGEKESKKAKLIQGGKLYAFRNNGNELFNDLLKMDRPLAEKQLKETKEEVADVENYEAALVPRDKTYKRSYDEIQEKAEVPLRRNREESVISNPSKEPGCEEEDKCAKIAKEEDEDSKNDDTEEDMPTEGDSVS